MFLLTERLMRYEMSSSFFQSSLRATIHSLSDSGSSLSHHLVKKTTMFCSISGEIPQEPVVSTVNGLLFEKNLILKAIKESGKCPVSGEDISETNLLTVNANKALRPRPITSASIPGLLSNLQNEWDEVMLESFTLRQHLDMTRQELSQALYQHDAACRLIARLTRERDEARNMIASLQASYGSGTGIAVTVAASADDVNTMTVEDNQEAPSSLSSQSAIDSAPSGAIPADVIAEINVKCKALSSKRKGRKPSEHLTPKEAMATLAQTASHTPHKTDSKTGVTCVAVAGGFGEDRQSVILSGSSDKQALLVEQASGKVLAKLVGHSKKVNAVAFRSATDSAALITASADQTVRLWDAASSSNKHTEVWCYSGHTSDVTGVAVHPTGNYMASVSADGSWHFLDLSRGACLKAVQDTTAPCEYSSAAFHPDGLILGTGTAAGVLRVWDIREQVNVANCAEHSGAVSSVAFSENGYLVATGSADGSVKIWDLRKLACTKTLDVGPGPVASVAFDYSGTYLAVGGGADKGQGLQVRVVKDWSESANLSGVHAKQVTAVAWAEHASALVTGAMDRTVRVFAPAASCGTVN